MYIAHWYPYTYSDLCKYLNIIENDKRNKDRIKRRVLWQTIAGNNLEVITITNFFNL